MAAAVKSNTTKLANGTIKNISTKSVMMANFVLIFINVIKPDASIGVKNGL